MTTLALNPRTGLLTPLIASPALGQGGRAVLPAWPGQGRVLRPRQPAAEPGPPSWGPPPGPPRKPDPGPPRDEDDRDEDHRDEDDRDTPRSPGQPAGHRPAPDRQLGGALHPELPVTRRPRPRGRARTAGRHRPGSAMVSVYDLGATRPTRPKQPHAAAVITGGTLSLVAGSLPLVAMGVAGDQGLEGVVAAAALPGSGASPSAPALAPVASQQPMTPAASPEVANLVKAVDLEAQRRAAEEAARVAAEEAARRAAEEAERVRAEEAPAAERAAREREQAAAADCGVPTGGLGAVKPWVKAAAQALACRHGEPRLLGVGSRGGRSDHPSGHAVDFMVDRAQGDALADCALRHRDELGITYVIWRQRINHGGGWEPMEDRGSVTANHYDHVHISFERSAPGGSPALAC